MTLLSVPIKIRLRLSKKTRQKSLCFLEIEFSGDGQQVSSTSNAILSSDMKLASQLLGENFKFQEELSKDR